MKSLKLLFPIAVIILFCFLFSCKKDKTQTIDFKHGYFPTDVGHYVIYDVDSISYSDFYRPKITIDTVHYYLKECIQSIFTDNTGQPTCLVAGYKSYSPNGPWNNYYTWTSNRTIVNAQKTEDNLRYTKLVFPPTLATSWQGNSHIDVDTSTNAYLAGWIYSYENIDAPLQLTSSVLTLSFDSTLTVLQKSYSNLVVDTFSVEKYAKNVGLIYKEMDILSNDSLGGVADTTIPWPKRANTGFIYRMTAIAYNK